MPLDQAHTHGTDWIQIDDDGGVLGPLLNAQVDPQGVEAGTFCYSRAGGRWWGCVVSNPATSTHAWALIGGGGPAPSPGALLLYVVAEAGTPMAVTGTFPDIDAAITQALADFGGPILADILVLPGTYPGFTLVPGAHIASLTEDSVFGDSVTITSTVVVPGGAGFFNNPSAIASVKGLRIDLLNADAVEEDGATPPTAGRITFSECFLSAQGANGLEFPNGAVQIELNRCNVIGTDAINAPGSSFDMLDTKTSGLLSLLDVRGEGCQFSSQLELVTAGQSLLRNCEFLYVTDPYIRLENGHDLSVDHTTLNDTFPDSIAVRTTGAVGATVRLLSGTFPGAKVYEQLGAGVLQIVTATASRVLQTEEYDQNAAGPTVYTVAPQTELVLFAATFAGASSSTITLPAPSRLPPNREVLIKRLDSNALASCIVNVAVGSIDALGSAVPSVVLGPNDSLRLVSRRYSTALGGACWLRVP